MVRRSWRCYLMRTHQLTQHFAAARQPRPYCADWNIQNLGYLLVAHAFEADEEDDLSLALGQAPQRSMKIAQL